MCYFQTVKFELYPELTRLHLGYQQASETEQEHYERAKLERKECNATNRERNASGQIPACELAQHKAAERKSDYQTTRYIVHKNPAPSDRQGTSTGNTGQRTRSVQRIL